MSRALYHLFYQTNPIQIIVERLHSDSEFGKSLKKFSESVNNNREYISQNINSPIVSPPNNTKTILNTMFFEVVSLRLNVIAEWLIHEFPQIDVNTRGRLAPESDNIVTPLALALMFHDTRMIKFLSMKNADIYKNKKELVIKNHPNLSDLEWMLASHPITSFYEEHLKMHNVVKHLSFDCKGSISALLKEYSKSPTKTKRRLMDKLGFDEMASSRIFALGVFIGSGFYEIKK